MGEIRRELSDARFKVQSEYFRNDHLDRTDLPLIPYTCEFKLSDKLTQEKIEETILIGFADRHMAFNNPLKANDALNEIFEILPREIKKSPEGIASIVGMLCMDEDWQYENCCGLYMQVYHNPIDGDKDIRETSWFNYHSELERAFVETKYVTAYADLFPADKDNLELKSIHNYANIRREWKERMKTAPRWKEVAEKAESE